jgi:hypothetical protein
MKFFVIPFIFLLPCLVFGQESNLNQTNKKTGKHGYWIIRGIDKPDLGFCDTCKIEEGNYVDNRRQGPWKKYNLDGTIRLTVEFDEGKPKGGFIRIGGTTTFKEESGHCFGTEK